MESNVEPTNRSAENRADLARILVAIALMAWLSAWGSNDSPRDASAAAEAEPGALAPRP